MSALAIQEMPLAEYERKQSGVRIRTDITRQLGHIALARDMSLAAVMEAAMVDWYNRQPEAKTYGLLVPTAPGEEETEERSAKPGKKGKKP